ncbi:hypothetical protein [Streptomyces vinaceus]|uniref:hypothetical protein n=1 Tax=Streptomyces vinaceus TaxID=1960 RepID=UPI0035DF902A
MTFKYAAVGLAALCVLGALGAPAASAANHGGKCKTTADMDGFGRPNATSRCTGGFPSGARHRAVITCDTVQGVREHVVRRTYRSAWAKTGSPAKVGCGFKSFLVGFASETRGN